MNEQAVSVFLSCIGKKKLKKRFDDGTHLFPV